MPLPTRLVLVLATTLALAACGPGIDEATRFTGSGSGSDARVRLINVADDKPSLDLYASDTVVQSGVALNAAGTYGTVAAGSVSLNVRAPGSTTQLSATTTTLANGDHRAVVASTSGTTFTSTLLSEDEGNPDRGNAKLRVVNLATTEAPSLDLFIAASCTGLASTVPATLAGIGGVSSYVQVTPPSTATRLCVTKAGDRTDVRLDLGSVSLSDQRIVTLILVRGMATGSNLVKGFTLDQQGAVLALTP